MEFISLSQLNERISGELKQAFPDTYWILAETSDVNINASNGHCYLEFIEKNASNGQLLARARGYIWRNTFNMLKPYFEHTTGQAFVSGLKVLVRVSVDFHPLYGYGLNVQDIDPTYTVGDMQRRRQEILQQLKAEGILTLNRELALPPNPQRVAVISSPTAAGYEDFLDHLHHNPEGFVFYSRLFPAIMQGEQTEASIIAALDKIYEYKDLFDVVVIIRGGGATSDLSAFDSYLLAANCAQFPLPIITGIGHERDETVLDSIAFRRAKTPTAVADYLVEQVRNAFDRLLDRKERLVSTVTYLLEANAERLIRMTYNLPVLANSLIERNRNKLDRIETFMKLSSPEYILAKGYSITMKDGKAVRSARQLSEGEVLETRLAEGTVVSVMKEMKGMKK